MADSISHEGEDEPTDPKLIGQIILGGLGAVLLIGGVWGYFGAQDGKIAGGFFVLTGLVVGLVAAFYSRIDGMVELGLLKIPVLKARRAEKQIELGLLVAGGSLDEAGTALQETLSRYNVSQSERNADGRNVLLVEDAVFTMTTLTPHEQHLVHAEVARMGRPDFRTDLDLRATRPGDAERSYRMHRVPEADIRLWYRQKSEYESHTLYLVIIEKTGEDLR